MRLYLIFTKKGLAVIFAAVIIFFIVIGQFSTIEHQSIDGSTNRKRIEYLNSLGLNVNETAAKVKETRIPESFSGIYSEYNEIQKEAGFKLANFCGKNATQYTYLLNDELNKTVNLLVVDDNIIAGDITDGLSGEISPLIKVK